jgi:hypothetical protein
MPHARSAASFALHSACLTALFSLAATTAALAQTGRVYGTVTNQVTGEPIIGAWVIVDTTRLAEMTDRHGRYEILDVPAGVYDIRVEKVGFEQSVYLSHRVEEEDRRMGAVHPTAIDFELRPLPTDTRDRAAPAPTTAIQPGFGMGFSLGTAGFGGDAHRGIGSGISVDASVRYGTAFGLFLHVGAQFGGNPVDSVDLLLKHFSVYVEPRFVLLSDSSRWAPFVGGRFAVNREQVEDPRARFAASGYSLSAVGGVTYRLGPQVAIEGGLEMGATTIGDYVLQGDAYSYNCVTGLEPGTSLSESVMTCGDPPDALAVVTCYAPFHTSGSAILSGSCDTPEVPQPGTGRSGLRYRIWFGFQLSFGHF